MLITPEWARKTLLHGGSQLFMRWGPDGHHTKRIRELLDAGGVFDKPIILGKTGAISDGHHRLAVARDSNLSFMCIVRRYK